MHKNETLIALLKDVRGDLSEEHSSIVDETLQQYEDDTPPLTPTLSTRPMEKRPRPASDETGRKTTRPNDAPTNRDTELDEQDGHMSIDQGVSSVGYLGRNSQVQWMRTLRRTLESPQDETSGMSYARHSYTEETVPRPMQTSTRRLHAATAAQALGDCYFYLDDTPLDAIDNVDPDQVPPADTAKQLFKFYQDAIGTPFRILDVQFEDQLQMFYEMLQRGAAPNICPRWKATMNLVFAIGFHFSRSVRAIWQDRGDDQHVYMSRAVHLLDLHRVPNSAGPPNQSLIQVKINFSPQDKHS